MRALGPGLWLWLALFSPAYGVDAAARPAAGLRVEVVPVFRPVSGAWIAQLGPAFKSLPESMAPPGSALAKLKALDWSKPEQARAAAPLVEQIEIALQKDLAGFSTLTAEEKHTHIALAADEVANTLPQLVYQKVDSAKAATWSDKSLTIEGHIKLWQDMLQLREIRDSYSAYLDETAREVVASAHKPAMHRVYDTNLRLDHASKPAAKNAQAKSPPPTRPEVAKSAQKLLESMKNSGAGWSGEDLRKVYEGHNFIVRNGGSHYVVKHRDFSELNQSYPYGKPGLLYVQDAVALIEAADKAYADAAAAAKPKTLSDEELEALTWPEPLVASAIASAAAPVPAPIEVAPATVDPLAPVENGAAGIAKLAAIEAPLEKPAAPPLAELTQFTPATEGLASPEGQPRRRRRAAAVEDAPAAESRSITLQPAVPAPAAEELSEPSGEVPAPDEKLPAKRESFLDRLKRKFQFP